MKLDAFWICLMISWIFLIGSWVLPLTTKNEKLKSLYGLTLSTLCVGINISLAIYLFLK